MLALGIAYQGLNHAFDISTHDILSLHNKVHIFCVILYKLSCFLFFVFRVMTLCDQIFSLFFGASREMSTMSQTTFYVFRRNSRAGGFPYPTWSAPPTYALQDARLMTGVLPARRSPETLHGTTSFTRPSAPTPPAAFTPPKTSPVSYEEAVRIAWAQPCPGGGERT